MSAQQGCTRSLIPLLLALTSVPALFGQNGRHTLTGHLRPGIVSANDLGRVDASLTLRQMILTLQPTPAQESDLESLVARQQDPASPDFHQWLTPDQFGARFGLSDEAIGAVTSWLAAQNLHVDSLPRGRTSILFTGAVRDVERAFSTEIHNYQLNGENHFANATEPSIPAALEGLIRVIYGLDDFRLKPHLIRAAKPVVEVPSYTSGTTGAHYLSPADVATIFNIAPLYDTAITGKGQKIAVLGQTEINLSNIEQFRTYFNLNANDPTVILAPTSANPGVKGSDLDEAYLDVEWAGAIAPDASIVYVYATDVVTALNYAINSNVAPVISMSYGLCENLTGTSGLISLYNYGLQAATEGISWIAASGDNGGNDCYGVSSFSPDGVSVDAPASVPGVTGVGGTVLTEGNGTYWKSANSANHASALSYIPESAWNDSIADGVPSSTGGGTSVFFAKPSWQAGAGVPIGAGRDVPDVSLPASADHDGYLVYTSGKLVAVGGTSAAAPVFAGIVSLLNQYLVANGVQTTPGGGLLNPRLYSLAFSAPGAFHDVTAGDNIVAGCPASHTCSPAQVGYSAAPGYDQATGLGSVNAFNMVTAWGNVAAKVKSEPVVKVTSSRTTLSTGDSTVLNATVTTTSGVGPTGTVTFYVAGVSLGSVKLNSGPGLAVTASQLVAGSPEAGSLSSSTVVSTEITGVYSGDSVYASAGDSVTVTVDSPGALVLSGITSAASFQNAYAPGMLVALFGQNLASGTPALPASPLPTQLAGTTVTINGVAAPLYYVSPTQINLQIPWEIPKDSTAIVKVTSNGKTATSQMPISKNAPEIFGDGTSILVPYQTTGRGQSAYLFATGDGLFSAPAVTTGNVPAAGTLSTSPGNAVVTVGGAAATTLFVGEPSWSIGVSQINFTIPTTAPLGVQPVVVTVGGTASAPVFITVTP